MSAKSEMIARKLARLSRGALITVTCSLDEVPVTGTVTDNNGTDCLEIRTGNGEEILLAYEEITALRIPKVQPESPNPASTHTWGSAGSHYPGGESQNPGSAGYPGAGGHQNTPGGSYHPAAGMPQNVPGGYPGAGMPQNVPGGGYPGAGMPRNVPGGYPGAGIPQNVPGGYPAAGMPQNVPGGGYPGAGIPQNVPGGYPAAGMPQNVPGGYPAAGMPQSIPGGGYPAAGMPQNPGAEGYPGTQRAEGRPFFPGMEAFAPPAERAIPLPTLSDNDLKKLFNSLPRKDRKKLNGSYDSFQYGIKCTDRGKMASAANFAVRTLLEDGKTGYRWDRSSSRFVGALCRRVDFYRPDVFLMGKWYREAGLACGKLGVYVEAGACAVLSLLTGEGHGAEMVPLLELCAARTRDISGLVLVWMENRSAMGEFLPSALSRLLSAEGLSEESVQNPDRALTLLKALYPGTAIADTARQLMEGVITLGEDGRAIASAEASAGGGREPENPREIRHTGWIARLDWGKQSGEIGTGEKALPFRYTTVTDEALHTKVEELPDSVPRFTIWVSYVEKDDTATDVAAERSPLELARAAADNYLFQDAMDQCQRAFGSPDTSTALGDLVHYALDWHKMDRRSKGLEQAAAIYEAHQSEFPGDAWHISTLGQLYYELGDLATALDFMGQCLAFPHLSAKLQVTFLAHSMHYCMDYYNENPDPALMETVRERAKMWLNLFQNSGLATDQNCQRYYPRILRWKCFAGCALDLTEEAEADYRTLLKEFPHDPALRDLRASIGEARKRKEAEAGGDPNGGGISGANSDAVDTAGAVPEDRSEAAQKTEAPPLSVQTVSAAPSGGIPPEAPESVANGNGGGTGADSGEQTGADSAGGGSGLSGNEDTPPEYGADGISAPETEDSAAEELDAPPYEDREGWDALGMQKADLVRFALEISGREDLPAAVAYLKTGADLNPALLPVYRNVALAVNDPLSSPDYSITGLLSALEGGDPDYPRLNDCCLGAAFLRMSFLSAREHDYNARAVRDSISVVQEFPALRDACDTMEEFSGAAGRAIDIYADYRNQGVKEIQEELDAIVARAEELYTRYIRTAPRESVRFKRLLETKKLLFAQDGDLAALLRKVADRDAEGLEAEKTAFAGRFLNGSQKIASKQISIVQVDSLIAECWDQVGKMLQARKSNSTLQGDRRNNLRSNITEILSTVCQWYALTERSAGITWRTEAGEEAYRRLKPQLAGQLAEVAQTCAQAREESGDPESRLGLLLLSTTAEELSARLDGSWRYEQENEFYTPFLKSDWILLDENLLPDLRGTFCALPEFNVFARIRAHTAGEKLDWQEHINRIYGPDRRGNNYGTADRIASCVRITGQEVSLPENAGLFVEQSAMQAKMQLQSFRESYALARNYGQILHSDDFCCRLEDTACWWYGECRRTGNYGFFASFLHHAEAQIHESARQYEEQLAEQLDALIATNQEQFDRHPGYADAIRTQIEQQNFIVAEDWMHRIRLDDFSLDIQQPEALRYLDDFWARYADTYRRVADTSRALSGLVGKKGHHNKDTKGAQRLIEMWLTNGAPSNPTRITALLNLLGWRNIRTEPYQMGTEARTELYRVTREPGFRMGAPLHPIAAFGSRLDREGMFVVCLYGTYDCDRLFEKLRTLDALDGNKIILLDYAMGGADRRALAQKIKQKESGLRNVYLVIDRVLICHLADVYNENLINRILMADALPFSYCQPYVVESSHTMPPEIFIGRKDELLKIEQPDGVNLLYGGRQLGKSALFKKARADLDGQDQRRAVLVDVKDCGCAEAAKRLSMELSEVGILTEEEITEDWAALCRSIRLRLRDRNPEQEPTSDSDSAPAKERQEQEEIRYLLVMLDEADDFIADCGAQNYRPLQELKNVQQTLQGRFKYVLAGLHNIVRFNREVALGQNSVITHLPSLKITPFRTPEAQELLTGPLSYLGLSLPSKVTVSQILATVNYFPGLIQLYCQNLVESLRAPDYAGYDVKNTPPYVITDDHLRRVMANREFVEQIREKFEITLRLDQDQGGSYYPLALLIGWMYSVEPSKGGYSARDVLHHAQDLGVTPISSLGAEKIDALMRELQDLNILRGVGEDTYLLASKNFRDLLGSDEEIFERLSNLGEASK